MKEGSNYTSYDQRERHAMVDCVVEQGMEVLRIPQVAQRLGEDAVRLTTLLQDVTVPNVRGSRLHLGEERDRRLMIVPVCPQEELYCHPSEIDFNEAQRESIRGGFNEESAELMIAHPQAYFRKNIRKGGLGSLEAMQALAYVAHHAAPLEATIGMIKLKSAPIVLLDAQRPLNRHPVVVLHELMHVYQLHEYPILMPLDDPYRLCIEEELEAYYVEAQIFRGYQDAGRCEELAEQGIGPKSMEAILQIDNVRRANQESDENKFIATDQMLAALAENKISLT